MIEIPFERLEESDLIVDTIYKGGNLKGKASEVLSKLLPGCSNSCGFRKVMRKDNSGLPAYVVLYTSMSELAWPDYLDEETGIFRYYGDNRTPGKSILDTPRKGNELLELVFECLNSKDGSIQNMPPFLIFKKGAIGWDVQFLGLAAPGNPRISPDKDLVAFWRTMNGQRFQNYEAYFTVLNTGSKPIMKEWIKMLIYDHKNSIKYAPDAWKKFVKEGRNGIEPLKASRIFKLPTRYEQLGSSDEEGRKCVEIIRNHYKKFPQGFEECAVNIISKMDSNFIDFSLTRPWRDGGRDAIGRYSISAGGKVNQPLVIDCALEAKCYGINRGVGVREMSRLISRIKYRQFGIMITTGFVDSQAYSEVVEDGHPILIVTAADIASILRNNAINSFNIEKWLCSVESENTRRLMVYYNNLENAIK